MSSRTLNLTPAVYDYLLEHGVRESRALAALREETSTLPAAMMQISPEQGAFMALLVRMLDARQVLEVGTFTGYSALAMAEALPPEGRITACDVSEDWTRIALRAWQQAGQASKIVLELGPALATLDRLIADGHSGQFDFMFIDADKTNYADYFERGLELVRSGGLIAVDNVLWGGRVADPQKVDEDTLAIRAVNELIQGNAHVDAVMLPIGDGLTLARKR
jgi:caffeoyl-CoA O-methyltransferase